MPQSHSPATRERILVYLQENRVVSVQQLSQAWGLTRADIRYHLNELVEEGLLELVTAPTRPVRRGRPQQTYRLAASHAPDNYPSLCSALLTHAFQSLTEPDRLQLLDDLAAQIAGPVQPLERGTQRFNQAISILNQRGYRARWEASAAGPRIWLRNCPYAAIRDGHPELCGLDLHLIAHLTGSPMKQKVCMDLKAGRPPACIFSTSLPA